MAKTLAPDVTRVMDSLEKSAKLAAQAVQHVILIPSPLT
jgi:hypothetical protein